jgi:hypothetical protein
LAAVDGGIILKLAKTVLEVAVNCEAPGVDVRSEAIAPKFLSLNFPQSPSIQEIGYALVTSFAKKVKSL